MAGLSLISCILRQLSAIARFVVNGFDDTKYSPVKV
jgi:hypothetical protein